MHRKKLALVVGGGPAPGINGVISAATIEASNHGLEVYGVVGGFKSLFEGNKGSFLPLRIDDVSRIHTTGGSILKTSRDRPENIHEKIKVLIQTLYDVGIDYLITIGGEGTLYMASLIERETRGRISIVHTPKTIDNDIPLPGGFSTFGYQTARHVGVNLVKNIMEDARTMDRWYFITTMGRHTGHLALGIGKAAGATLTLIPEEFPEKRLSVQKVADILAGAIIKRYSMGRSYGVAILAEGIVEKFDIDELSKMESVETDEVSGKIRISDIQLGRVLKSFVLKTLAECGIKTTIVTMNIGYELRAADPIPFDIEYTRDLGYGAVNYLMKGGTGALITVYEGKIMPVPFVEMFDSNGNIKIRRVNIESERYKVAREYMIRLEKEDFQGERLEKLADSVKMTPERFKNRFGYLFDLS
ncbi:MAG: diphosphate--fructose-6-phosphate 1-phosphotransferase [Desulfobacterota bacterium]|nr:diphosphate--fructose-6-phosphate 1-phosphotransferase [Thermodesulfobacteriota bacterium]MDW8001105.1 diphosphate--fructose-6-phosphate 1-phosphotransferase [Deltaproteobacteria bacterium]